MKRSERLLSLSPAVISLIYLITAFLWIMVSDAILAMFVQDPELISRYQTIKGILYVISTAALLYYLIRKSNSKTVHQKELLDKSLNSAKMATWTIDLDTLKNNRSENHHEIFGLSKYPDSWTLQDFFDRIHPEDLPEVKEKFHATAHGESPVYKVDFRIIWPDDSVHWARSRGTLIRDENGEPDQMSGVIMDITEQKNIELDYKHEKELFEQIFKRIPVLIDIYNPELDQIRVNPHFEKVLGWSQQEIRNMDLMEAVYPDDKVRERAYKVMGETDGLWHEFPVHGKNGNKHIQLWSNFKLSDDTTIGIGIDITEEKTLENQLLDSIQLFRRAEEVAELGHFQRDFKTDEVIWSDGVYELFGISEEEPSTKFSDLVQQIIPEDRQAFIKDIEEAKNSGRLVTQFRLKDKTTGELKHINGVGRVSYNDRKEAVRISGTIQDITRVKMYEDQIKKRSELFETTIQNLPIGVAVNTIDDGQVTLMNSEFEKVYGWPNKVLTDVQSFFENVYPDPEYRAEIMEMIMNDIQRGDPEKMEWKGIKITRKDGTEAIVNAKNIPIYDQNIMISTVTDVTTQVTATRKIEESEQNYRSLFENNPLPMFIYDPTDLSFVEVNQAAVDHYGYSAEEFNNMSLLDIRPEQYHDAIIKNVRDIDMNSSVTEEWKHRKKNGEIIDVQITGSSISYFDNTYRLVLAKDITLQKQAEARVLASYVEGENMERTRLAHEIHDGLGQYLAAAGMNFDAMKDSISDLEKKKQKQFNTGFGLLKQAIDETGTISHNLMPRVVQDYGLVLAIQAIVSGYDKEKGIPIKYYHNVGSEKIDEQIQYNLYRIFQEAISNAIKYSQADQISVQLIADKLDLMLSIEDNGIGFDINDNSFNTGLGMRTIRNRTDALGGQLTIESRPTEGTLIHISVPMNNLNES